MRDAARSYLRAPGVATHDLALKFSGAEFAAKVKSLKEVAVNGGGRPYFQDYLLLITARDVFYNLGLIELAPYLGKIRNKEPGALGSVLAPFDAGMKLGELTGKSGEKVALAKNSYGKALAMFELAVNLEAAAKCGVKERLSNISKTEAAISKPLDDKGRRPRKSPINSNCSLPKWRGVMICIPGHPISRRQGAVPNGSPLPASIPMSRRRSRKRSEVRGGRNTGKRWQIMQVLGCPLKFGGL